VEDNDRVVCVAGRFEVAPLASMWLSYRFDQ